MGALTYIRQKEGRVSLLRVGLDLRSHVAVCSRNMTKISISSSIIHIRTAPRSASLRWAKVHKYVDSKAQQVHSGHFSSSFFLLRKKNNFNFTLRHGLDHIINTHTAFFQVSSIHCREQVFRPQGLRTAVSYWRVRCRSGILSPCASASPPCVSSALYQQYPQMCVDRFLTSKNQDIRTCIFSRFRIPHALPMLILCFEEDAEFPRTTLGIKRVLLLAGYSSFASNFMR